MLLQCTEKGMTQIPVYKLHTKLTKAVLKSKRTIQIIPQCPAQSNTPIGYLVTCWHYFYLYKQILRCKAWTSVRRNKTPKHYPLSYSSYPLDLCVNIVMTEFHLSFLWVNFSISNVLWNVQKFLPNVYPWNATYLWQVLYSTLNRVWIEAKMSISKNYL